MLNPRHLASLIAISDHGGFSAAANVLGRSHSAISLHIKALEEELGTRLLDRSVRPPALTVDGETLVEQGRRLQEVLNEIASVGQQRDLAGRLAVGIVPTAMTHIVPPALARLRVEHPGLVIDIRTGLSGEVAEAVRGGALDAAVVTAPVLPPEGLITQSIVTEPLVVIAPASAREVNDSDLLMAHPFIWFSRRTWAGQQIERKLQARRIRVRAEMEVDSLEAIQSLVRHGLGVAVVPDTGALADELTRVPFGDPQAMRELVLMTRPQPTKGRLLNAFYAALTA
jgi:DNA-binding transcriptional LysR family regulator